MANIRIRECLKENGLTIEDLRKRLNVNRQTVNYYIKQNDKNPVSQLQKIADVIGCDLIELFTEKNTTGAVCPHCHQPIKLNITKE